MVRSGELAFVTVRHVLTVDGAAVAVEEQDTGHRSELPGAPRRAIPRPPAGHPAPTGAWQLDVATGPVLLARVSALTYDGHRIRDDHRHVTEVARYPDLVVHGPLLALLALELPRNATATVTPA